MATEGRHKASIVTLKTKPLERSVALARLGVGAGAKIMAHSLANIFRGEISRDSANREFYERQAQILADELGKLKGSVMKDGQMLWRSEERRVGKGGVSTWSTRGRPGN